MSADESLTSRPNIRWLAISEGRAEEEYRRFFDYLKSEMCSAFQLPATEIDVQRDGKDRALYHFSVPRSFTTFADFDARPLREVRVTLVETEVRQRGVTMKQADFATLDELLARVGEDADAYRVTAVDTTGESQSVALPDWRRLSPGAAVHQYEVYRVVGPVLRYFCTLRPAEPHCPKCGHTVRERPLLNGIFVGCLC